MVRGENVHLGHYVRFSEGRATGTPLPELQGSPNQASCPPTLSGTGGGGRGEVLPGTGCIWDRGSSVLEFQASNINRTRAPFEFQTPGPVPDWSRRSHLIRGGGVVWVKDLGSRSSWEKAACQELGVGRAISAQGEGTGVRVP